MLGQLEINTEAAFPIASVVTVFVFILHWVIMAGLGLRIILKRRPTGVSLAWLLVVGSVPFAGAVLYLFVGELWLPKNRIERYKAFKDSIASNIERIDHAWDVTGDELSPLARSLNAQANSPLELSAVGGNAIELFDRSELCIKAIVDDIDNAKSSVSMLFYIWQSGGGVDLVEAALIRAVERGVVCRVMLDSAGSKKFIRKKGFLQMRDGGVEVLTTLPAGLFRVLFARIDIRNHRKIITIDHDIAYTGSMNMVDPKCFKVKGQFGQWVDVMARVGGPAARVLDMTSNLDWAMEAHDAQGFEMQSLMASEPVEAKGKISMQVVPSGPDQGARVIHDMLLTLIYTTTERLIITTPYFIPSEAMLTAMTAAAMRGVQLTLVVPKKIDSILVRHASKSYFQDLLEAGVEIRTYRGGLLHSKTVTADGQVALLGTVNMDKRSFSINFEVSLFAYDEEFVKQMCMLQESYIADSDRVDLDEWMSRSVMARIVQNSVQLLAPIL